MADDRIIPTLAAEFAVLTGRIDDKSRQYSTVEALVFKGAGLETVERKDRLSHELDVLYLELDKCMEALDQAPAATLEDVVGKLAVAEERLSDEPSIEHRLVADALRALPRL